MFNKDESMSVILSPGHLRHCFLFFAFLSFPDEFPGDLSQSRIDRLTAEQGT